MKTLALCVILIAAALPSLCGQGTWTYDFKTQGINSTYWTSTGDPLFTYTSSAAGATIAAGPGGGGVISGSLSLNLNQFPALTGDFSLSGTLIGATFPSSGLHQVQLGVTWQNPGVYEVRSNQYGINMWVNGVTGIRSVGAAEGTSSAATFTLTRVADVVTAYWNETPFWNAGGYNTNALTDISLMSQKNGTSEPVQVTWESFSLTSAAIPEPSTYAALAGLGALGLAVRRRRR